MSHTLSLYRLQQIDSQLERAQARLQAIQKELENDANLLAAKETASAAEAGLQSATRGMKDAEFQVQNQRIKIEQTESSLFGGTVRNPKELQDLQNDVGSLKRYLTVLEDRLLESMMAAEEAETAHHAAQAILQSAQANWAAQNQNLNQERSTLLKEIEKLTTERAATHAPIPADALALYDQLRQQRRGVAVATITDQSCDACGSSLTPSEVQSARSTVMARCPSCGRILYGN